MPIPVRLVPAFVDNFPEVIAQQKGKDAKLIVQISRTNCAGAIWRIHEAINRYTGHICRTITVSDTTNGRKFQHDVFMNQVHEVKHLISKADIIHFHNWIDHESPEMMPYRKLLEHKNKVLQYHTEPALLQKQYRRDVINRDDLKTLVIAQKHLRFYPKSKPVPNIIDIWDDRLRPIQRNNKKLTIIYTPSDLKAYATYGNTCCGKGYPQVLPILKQLQDEGIIDYQVITDKTWEELMPLKQMADVCIDECVTGGYHLCSLEALAQGLVTIAWLDGDTRDAIKRIVGRDTELPWVNTEQSRLEETLRRLANDPALVKSLQIAGRKWMEEHWNPVRLVDHFIKAYDNIQSEEQVSETVSCKWGTNNHGLQSVYNVPGILRANALALKEAWPDQRVVIWGNGPTALEAVQLIKAGSLGETKHIGTNAAAKLDMQFDAYCIGDKRFLEVPEKRSIALNAPGVLIYNSVLSPMLPENLPASYVKTLGRDGFCTDLQVGCYHGYSIVWFALQVAVWTGAKDILLAGCGHDYTPDQPRFYKEARVSDIDNTFPRILNNYRQVIPLLSSMGIQLRTIGRSRLADAGVRQYLSD